MLVVFDYETILFCVFMMVSLVCGCDTVLCLVHYSINSVNLIEYVVHGSKNGLLWYNLTYFGAYLLKMSTTF